MSEIRIPFGEDFESVSLKENEVGDIYTGEDLPVLEKPENNLKEKLRKNLPKYIKNKKVAIVIDDITRPTPSHKLVKWIVDELNIWGVPDENVTVIVARGLHRPQDQTDIKKLLGIDLAQRIKTIVSDPDNGNVDIGETKYGTRVSISRHLLDSDYRITTGYINPHQSAGYTGGRKSIVPGIASRATIKTHHAKWGFHESAKMGVLENNLHHLDMEEAALMAGVDLIVNVVLTNSKKISYIAVGDLREAHCEGVARLEKAKKVFLKDKPQVVVTSPGGFPLDIDLRTAQKALPAAEMVIHQGGCIVLVAECREGLGMTESFIKHFQETPDPRVIMNNMKKVIFEEGYSQTNMQIYFFARALTKAKIVLVSKGVDAESARKCQLIHASTLEEGLEYAREIIGKKVPVVFFPSGPSIIPAISDK